MMQKVYFESREYRHVFVKIYYYTCKTVIENKNGKIIERLVDITVDHSLQPLGHSALLMHTSGCLIIIVDNLTAEWNLQKTICVATKASYSLLIPEREPLFPNR